jgi:hypothetical protein
MKVRMPVRTEAARMILQYMAVVVKKDLAKQCAIRSCQNIIEMVDTEMQGWCDTDIISHYKLVIKEIEDFVI